MKWFIFDLGFMFLISFLRNSVDGSVSTNACPENLQPCVKLMKHRKLCSSLDTICSAIENGNISSSIASFSQGECGDGAQFCPTTQACHQQNATCDLDTVNPVNFGNATSFPWGGECAHNKTFCATSMSCIPVNTVCSMRNIYEWHKAHNTSSGPYGRHCNSNQSFCLSSMECLDGNSTCKVSINSTVFQSFCYGQKHAFCPMKGACIPNNTSCKKFEAFNTVNVTDPGNGWKELCEVRQSICTRYAAGLAKCFPLISHCFAPCGANETYCKSTGQCQSVNKTCCLSNEIYCNLTGSCQAPENCCPSNQTFCNFTNKCHMPDQYCCPTNYTYCNFTKKCHMPEYHCCPQNQTYCNSTKSCTLKERCCPDNNIFCDFTNVCTSKENCCPKNQTYCNSTKSCTLKERCCPDNNIFCDLTNVCTSKENCCPKNQTYCNFTKSCTLKERCCPDKHVYCNLTMKCHPPEKHCCPLNHSFCNFTKSCHAPERHCCPDKHVFCNLTMKCYPPEKHCCPLSHSFCNFTKSCHAPEKHCCPNNHTFCNSTKRCLPQYEHCCPKNHNFCNFTRKCQPQADHCCPKNTTFCKSTGTCLQNIKMCCPSNQSFCEKTQKCHGINEVCCLKNQNYCNTTNKCHSPGELCCPVNEPNCQEAQLFKTAVEFDELGDSSAYLFSSESDTIAITHFSDDVNGSLEYFNEISWVPVHPNPTPDSALVLGKKNILRFNASDPDFHGVVLLNYTHFVGTVGQRVNASGSRRGEFEVIALFKFPNLAPAIPPLNDSGAAYKILEDDRSNKGFSIKDKFSLKKNLNLKMKVPKGIESLLEPTGLLAYKEIVKRANNSNQALQVSPGKGVDKSKGQFLLDSLPLPSTFYLTDIDANFRFVPALDYHGEVHAHFRRGVYFNTQPLLTHPYIYLLPDIVQEYTEIYFIKQKSNPNVKKEFYNILGELHKTDRPLTKDNFINVAKDLESKATGSTKTDITAAKDLWTKAFAQGAKAVGRELVPSPLTLIRINTTKGNSIFAYDKNTAPHDIIVSVLSVNDAPKLTSKRAFMPALPYNLTATPEDGVTVGELIARGAHPFDGTQSSLPPLGKDKENDTLGVGIVYETPNKFGQYKYKETKSSQWKPIKLNNTLKRDKLEGVQNVLLLTATAQITFVPFNNSYLWSDKEGRDKLSFYFVIWDQSDNKSAGIHQFDFPVGPNSSLSDTMASAFTGRKGCDRKQGSKGHIDVCGKCGGDGKWCLGCDGIAHSKAVFDHCNNCTGGTTNVTFNFRQDCGGGCGTSYIDHCGECQKRGKAKNFTDCAGVCHGKAFKNRCGHCVGGSTSKPINLGMDLCGICGGTNASCKDCDGTPNGGKVMDSCDKCLKPSDSRFDAECTKLVELEPISGDVQSSTKIRIRGAGLQNYKTAHCELFDLEAGGKSLTLPDASIAKKVIFVETSGKYTPTEVNLKDNAKTFGFRCKFDSDSTYYTTKQNFTFYNSSVITITSLSTNESEADTGSVNLTISGSNFPSTGFVKCITDDGAKYYSTFIDQNAVECSIPNHKYSKKFRISPLFGAQDSLHKQALGFEFFALSPQPTLVTIDQNLQFLRVKMNKPSKHKSESKSCDGIFKTVSLNLFGNKKQCIFRTPTEMIVVLSGKATVKPGDEVEFIKGSVDRANEKITKINGSGTVRLSVRSPTKAVIPEAKLSGPDEVGACADIELDASQSYGAGGRRLEFHWTVRWSDDQDTSNLPNDAKTDITAIQGIFSKLQSFSPIVKIPRENVKLDLQYEFAVSVKNFLGKTSTNATLVVVRKNKQLPTIEVGMKRRKIKASRPTMLQATVILSPCVNLSTSDSKVLFKWEINAIGIDLGVIDRPMLRIKAGLLEGGKDYIVTVTVTMATDQSLVSSKEIILKVETSDLIARIDGGSYQSIGAAETLKLDASRSRDPDKASGTPWYKWECADAENFPCFFKDKDGKQKRLKMKSEAVVNVDVASTLKSNQKYTFTVTVNKGKRKATRSVVVKVDSGAPPRVKILPQREPKQNPTERIFIKAYVKTTMSNTTVTWSFVREDGYGFLDLSKKGAALTAVQFTINKEAGKTKKTRRFALVLPAYSLEDGVKYKIKLTASHADATGISETIIVTNAAPSKGILDVSPISGTALDTKFSLKATEGWSDAVEDLPLQFSFGYFGYDDKEVYLSFFGLDVVKEDIVFSPGNPARNNNLTVFVDAEDAYGAITRQTATISVRPMGNISSEFLKGYKDDIFKSSESGDINKAISDIGVIFQTVESGSKVDKTELLNLKEDLISNLGFKLLKPGGAASGSKSKRTIKKSIIPLTRGGMSLKDSTRIKLADMLLDLEKSGSKGSKRRRRRATDSSTTVEVYTVAQAQTTLELISNLIDPMNYSSTNMQLKSKLLTTSDTSGINLCAGLAVGMAAAVVEDRLLVLRSEKNPFTDVATAFIDIACTACSGSLSKTAKVRLGTTLKDQYSAWKCSSSDDLCSGTCVVTSQQIYNLLSTSAAIDNSTLTNVVDIKMHNPETYAAISVSSLATPVTYHLPVVNVALTNDTYFECKRWDSGSSSWSSSGCVTKQELIVDQGTQYIECQCTELGYTAAFRTDHPPTTPTPSTIATSALTVKIRTVQFALLGDYDTYVTSANEDQFIKNVTQKVATVMNISELRVTNMTLSKGSIIVKFVLLPGPSDTEESLTSTLSLLEVAVKSGNFTLKLSDGTVLKADPTSFTWAVGSDLTTEPEVAPTATTGLTKTEIIIISCVCGAIALIVLILIVVFCWKKKRSGKRQISPASSEGEMIGRQNDVELRNRGHDNATAQRESYTSTKNI